VSQPSDEDIDAELAALRCAFVARMPSRLAMLTAAMTAIIDADGSQAKAALEELEKVAHGISGSAGLFGYAGISVAAAALEQACLDCSKADAVDQEASGRLRELYEDVMINAETL
jgi:HPt (histidine-containing phosphotransfer) domain-containing protein